MPRLELGCGSRPTPGYLHADRWKHSAHVDVAFDLEHYPWPLDDGELSELLAQDVFEHMHGDVQVWLDECWRVLQPGGLLDMRLPSWDHPQGYGFRDPTHQRLFHPESFSYWCPNAPGSLWQDFGRYYFGPGYCKWWQQQSVAREFNDLRYRLCKIA